MGSLIFNTIATESEVFDKYLVAFTFLLFLYFSKFTKQEKLYMFLITIISILVARILVTPIFRFIYYHPYPFHTNQLRLLFSENEWSFPSGHSAFLAASATTIFLYNKKWGMGFYIYAMVMIIIRILAGMYYPLDCIIGIVIGMFTSYIIFFLFKTAVTRRNASK